LVLVLVGLFGLVGCSHGADVIVRYVYDGDSFVMSNGDEIRLIGIDAPEKDEPGADESKTFLTNLIQGKNIRLEADKEDKDKYHRLLRYAYLPERQGQAGIGDTFINDEMIKNGYAVTLFIPPNNKYRAEFTAYEKLAKEAKKGLWANGETIQPPGVSEPPKQETPKEITVYVTGTGKKYHRAGCSSLSKTRIAMTLEKAKKDYLPCKQCDPPN